jgi:hypothetical protein
VAQKGEIMGSIRCGNCKKEHETVAEVKACYGMTRNPVTIEVFDYTTPRSGIPEIAAGYYAVESATGNNDLDFYRVDRPTEGRWAGRTFVKRIIGGNPDIQVRGAEARNALNRILAAGPDDAKKKYGQEIGQCGECNRHLTDETSRELGIGPVCRSN